MLREDLGYQAHVLDHFYLIALESGDARALLAPVLKSYQSHEYVLRSGTLKGRPEDAALIAHRIVI
jgi:hypothetical protein